MQEKGMGPKREEFIIYPNRNLVIIFFFFFLFLELRSSRGVGNDTRMQQKMQCRGGGVKERETVLYHS